MTIEKDVDLAGDLGSESLPKKIDVMIVLEMPEYSRNHLAEKYEVHYWPEKETHLERLDDPLLKKIRGVQTNGSYGLKRPMIEAMPNLEIICAVGAGYDGVDLEAAWERGIVVTNGAGTNADTVADQAWSIMLGAIRRVPLSDRGVREGRWNTLRVEIPTAAGKKLGIFGLGHVGRAIARRGSGFDMEIGYHARNRREDVPYRYFEDILSLARWADILVLAAPGNAQTYHVVDKAVLEAIGPEGFVVNAARGSLLDSDALVEALRAGRIAGAALDVIEGEPEVPESFLGLENLVLSPHIGGFSPEAIKNMIHKVRDNLDAHFSGRPVLSPVLREGR